MSNEPQDPTPAVNPLGSTMRIDLSPEAIEEAKRKAQGESGRRRSGHIVLPKVRAVAPAGGVDFQQLLQSIYDGAVITDLHGAIVMTNVRANQFFHGEPGQLINQSVLVLINGADDSLLPTINEALKANRFVLMQAVCIRTDGTEFPAEISINRLRLGIVDHLCFFFRDITLRKEQEERLRTGHTALQTARSGLAITDLDGRIEYWNPAFLSLCAITEEKQIEGRDLRDLLSVPAILDEVMASVGGGAAWAGELEMKRVDGTTFFGQASVVGNLNTDGQPVGMVLSVLDVTPQKRAQQQLQAYASELNARNAQMQEDLDIASELHRTLLPTEFNTFPAGAKRDDAKLLIRNLYSPSGTIGGDFFDIRALSEHEIAILVSDVMGHGIRAALVVATVRGLIEQLRAIATDPGAFLTQLNATYASIFKHIGGTVIFSTALYAVIDTRTGTLRCSHAGHPRPFVLRRSESRCERLAMTGRSAALGIIPDTQYRTWEFRLAVNDLLLLYTDGLSEAESPAGDLYESHRFEDALRTRMESPGQELLDGLVADAKAFSGREVFEDDVCLVAVEVEGLG